jgi:SAM-dependent methyltransferase
VTLLASPCCKADLDALACSACGAQYRQAAGVPLLMDEPTATSAAAERFDKKYRSDDDDPWRYRQRAAEVMKYRFLLDTAAGLLEGPEATVADVGCAQGLLSEQLCALTTRAVAVDLSPHAVARLKARTGGRLEVAAASALELPFKPGSMQLLVLSDGLVSWGLSPEQRVAAVREAARALAPTGHALFMEYLNPRRHHELLDAVRDGGLTVQRVHYLGDRLWYVAESAFRALDGTAVFRAVGHSLSFARALQRVSSTLGPRGSKHLCAVATR